MGWDPTDPNPKNPYNKISYTDVATGTKTVTQNKNVKILKDVKAKTAWGRNLTSKIKVTVKTPGKSSYVATTKQTMKLNKIGTYVIVYNVKDIITGLSKKHTVKYIVKKDAQKPSDNTDKEEDNSGNNTGDGTENDNAGGTGEDDSSEHEYEVRIEGLLASYDIEYMEEVDLKAMCKVYNSADEDITDMLEFELKGPGSDRYIEFEGDMLILDEEGVYEVVYKVWNPETKKYIKQTTIYNSIVKN
jgi:hypothetical protein